MTNSKMMARTAKNLCDFLNTKGIKTESNFTARSIDKTLRYSWYVKKAKELGYTDCIHINLEYWECSCGFFAILNDGKIMTGGNCMIADAFGNFCANFDIDFDKVCNFDVYFKEMGDDDFLIIASLPEIRDFFAGVDDDELLDDSDDENEPF